MLSQALRPGLWYAVVGFALAGVAAACGEVANPAGPSPAASGLSLRADVPLKGTLDGTYALEFAGPTLLVTGEGTGNATQLGRFTFEYDEVVDLSTGIGTGTYELTAANGDRLIAHWTGYGVPTDDPAVLRIVENATITGGTGRFANATGIFTVERLFNFVTSAGPGSISGTMRLGS